MRKVKVATVWFDGCSGCHMSVLDMDAGIIALLRKVDIVYGPLVDAQEFPEDVDVTLVEGAISTHADVAHLQKIRARTRVLIALGDCAVTSNVPGMRNPFGVDATMQRAFHENAELQKQNPSEHLPKLLERVRPVHEVVKVDVFVPGCPPPADAIWRVLTDLLAGQTPPVAQLTRFGK